MRIASFLTADGRATYGVVEDQTLKVVDRNFERQFPDLRSVLVAGELRSLEGRAQNFSSVSVSDVKLCPPIPFPEKIICVGLNYRTHILETGREVPTKPSIFTRYPNSLVGHQCHLVRPRASDDLDFEGELAFVIGRSARHVAAGNAMEYVAGFTCFNDGSVRDFQRHTTQFWPGKNFESSGAAGPWLVTPDEVGNIGDLSLTTRLNGEVMQETSINDLVFDIGELIEYISTICVLKPGDVIATGTPSGVGRFRDPPRYMAPGDRIEVQIDNVGRLINSITAE